MKKIFIILTLSLFAISYAQKEKELYLFTSFREPATEGLYLAYSEDGYNWKGLEGSFLKPEIGASKIMRDPSITKGVDGTYHMVWTTDWKGGNGFGYAIIPDNGISNAIVVGGMGRERNLVLDHRITDFTPTTHIKGTVNREGIRKMTPREWARLQGFPDEFLIPVADASAYKQFGNSVAVPAIQATANEILKLILKTK